MTRFSLQSTSLILLMSLSACKGWFSEPEDTGDPVPVDTSAPIDTSDTEDTDTGDTEDTEDTGEINLPPSAPSVAIEPTEPTEEDNLSCVVTSPSIDPEGVEVTYQYAWTVDGQDPEIDTATVDAGLTWVGHEWTCYAWATDGKHESDVASASVTVGQSCYDGSTSEPNESESSAASLGEVEDGDDPKTIEGVINGEDDRDWYAYIGRDTLTGRVGPGISIDADGAPVRTCLFASCLNGVGKTEVECENGGVYTVSPSGLPGCCSYADIDIDLNCDSTSNDEAAMYIHAYSELEDICQPYEISFWY